MSAIGKAAAKFEKAFTGLPPGAREAAALAIYRAAPAMQQYQRDLAPLMESDELKEAVWDVFVAVALGVLKYGREPIKPKHVEEMKARAPETFDFMTRVVKLIEGVLPGSPAWRALPPAPPALPAPEDDPA